jgi:hypothetical protein
VPAHLLNEGTYRLTLLILRNGSKIAYRMDEALTFDVGDVEVRSGAWYGKEPGVVRPQLHWQTQFLGIQHHEPATPRRRDERLQRMPFLEEAVRSISAERLRPEFLVVDDGSDDGSAALLQQWRQRDERMTVLCHRVNQASPARHTPPCGSPGVPSSPARTPTTSRCRIACLGKPPTWMANRKWAWSGRKCPSSGSRAPARPGSNPISLSAMSDLQSQLLVSNCFCAGSVMMRREV